MVVDALIIKAEISWRSDKLDEGLGAVEEGENLLARMGQDHIGEKEGKLSGGKGSYYIKGALFTGIKAISIKHWNVISGVWH